jgi:hypothetical protein
MDLYEYIIENEETTNYYYYSWPEEPDKVISYFIRGLRDQGSSAIDIVDLFPEPNSREMRLASPLEIQTKMGKTMYLPEGFDVVIHTKYRILFEFYTPEK